MSAVAVVAHNEKTLPGGLEGLRRELADGGVPDPFWREVEDGDDAPGAVAEALAAGAELIFIWGGDGTVRRCLEQFTSSGADLALLPAGTGNLLASNLGVPGDVVQGVQIGLRGRRVITDTGTVNGERFAVMAGAGFDARMIAGASKALKSRFGRAAYVWAGARALGAPPIRASIRVDGALLYRGALSCILVGNMNRILGGMKVFQGSQPDDGLLEVGVVTARGRLQWLWTLLRVLIGRAERSPFVVMARGTDIRVTFDHAVAYELDGDLRDPARELQVRVDPGSLAIRVPNGARSGSGHRNLGSGHRVPRTGHRRPGNGNRRSGTNHGRSGTGQGHARVS